MMLKKTEKLWEIGLDLFTDCTDFGVSTFARQGRVRTITICDGKRDVLPSCLMVTQDDLPSISISRLRATGAVTAEMTKTTIGVADVEVCLQLVKFANGGSWSFFLCPHCGRRARTLKLFEEAVLCWRCCHHRGARYRVWTKSVRGRAEHRASKLALVLDSKASLRLKPHLWGTMERRKRHEAALARAEFIISRKSRRYRDVQIPEIEPEPIRKPKVTPSR
jgi:hypothetical protein